MGDDADAKLRRIQERVDAEVATPRAFDPATMAAAQKLNRTAGELTRQRLAGALPGRVYADKVGRLLDAATPEGKLAAMQLTAAMVKALKRAGTPEA